MSLIPPEVIHVAVRDRYERLAQNGMAPGGCCEPAGSDAVCCVPIANEGVEAAGLPADMTALSLGCGDPLALAGLEPGQVVLDLGSGTGLDCFRAAERVGPTGHVIGVDMTAAMLERARRNQARLGLDNVAFRLGQIEALPIADASVDVIISNCVINLSPDKGAVLREVARVLRPGGRLAVSDIVTLGELPPPSPEDLASWSECVAGAESIPTLVRLLREAGLTDISVRDRAAPERELSGLAPSDEAPRLLSASISAQKPRQAEAAP